MKKTIFTIAVMAVITVFLASCQSWDIEIINPYDVISNIANLSPSSSEESSESEPDEPSGEQSEPESENEPEQKEQKPDSDYGIKAASAEETLKFTASLEQYKDLAILASWLGATDFETTEEAFTEQILWWYMEELYEASGEEDALYEDGHFFRVEKELGSRYIKRYFGVDYEPVFGESDFCGETGDYKIPTAGGGAPNKFLSCRDDYLEENRVKYTVLLAGWADELGKSFHISEMVFDVMKDGEELFLRPVSCKKTETFREASFEEQAKILTLMMVEHMEMRNIENGVMEINSESAFRFIVRMLYFSTDYGSLRFDKKAPYIGESFWDEDGYTITRKSAEKIAKEVFGIGNFELADPESFSFKYDEEEKKYTSGLQFGMESGTKAENLETYIIGTEYVVRFDLVAIESVNGDPVWVNQGNYKMTFELVDGKYLQYRGIDKA